MNWMQPMVSQPYPIEKYKPNMIGQTLPMPKTDFKETRFDLSPLAAFKSAFDTGITNFSARSKNSYQNSLQNFYRSQSPYENLNRGNYTTNQDLYGSTYMQQGGIADLDKQYQKYQDLAYVAQQEGDSEFVNEFLQPKMSKIETERKTLDDYFNEQRVQDEINQIRKSIPQYQDQQYIDPYQRTQIRHHDYNDNQSDEEPSYTSSFGIPSPKVGFNMYNRAKSLEGMVYQMGAKGQNNKIDCSGAVCKIVGAPTMTSEDLTTHGKNFRQYNGPDDLKEGTVIGFDFGPKKHDVGRKHGIDHTGVIVKNPQTNELEYKESVSGTGFRTLSLPAFLQKYPNRAKQMFVSNYLQQGGSIYNRVEPNSIDPGHKEVRFPNGLTSSTPLNTYETSDLNDPEYKLLSDFHSKNLHPIVDMFNEDVLSETTFENKMFKSNPRLAELLRPTVNNVSRDPNSRYLDPSISKGIRTSINQLGYEYPSTRLNDLRNSRNLKNLTSILDMYQHPSFKDDKYTTWKKEGFDNSGFADKSLYYKGEETKDEGYIFAGRHPYTVDIPYPLYSEPKPNHPYNTLNSLQNPSYPNNQYSPNIIGKQVSIPGQNLPPQRDRLTSLSNPTQIGSNYKPNLVGNPINTPSPKLGLNSINSSIGQQNYKPSMVGSPVPMVSPQMPVDNSQMTPLDIYDRRGNFLRQEQIRRDDHGYISRKKYAPRGGNSYIDIGYPIKQQGGSFYNTLKSQNKPIIDANKPFINNLLQQPQIDQIKKQEALNKQIANYDRTFSKTQSETPISKLKSKQLKASYVYNNPYSQLDEDGNITPIANDRDLQGVPKFGTQAYRTDDGLKNIMHGLDAAMLVEGIGHLGYKGLRNLGEYITTKTPLKNASEYNPWRFKANTESYYRGIGRSGYDDAVESGMLRTGNKMANFGEDLYMTSNFDVAKGNYSVDKATYKGNPFGGADDYWEKILPKDTKSYIAEIPKNVLTNPREVGTGTGIMVNKGALPLDKIKFYKEHWLKGYKEVPKPTYKTSNSIMYNPEGQIQFLDNETYRDALVTGKKNIINYLSDPKYKKVVERNQQLANRLNMNRLLPIQKEMNNTNLHDARMSKINQPLTILDPRPLETEIITGTNKGIQAQYSRNLDGSGFLRIPRINNKETTIKNVEHESLHHIYPNLGEGFPSFTPLETKKVKTVFKNDAALRNIEKEGNLPFWYLDDADELVPNSFDLATDLGIQKFQQYPGMEPFKTMLDSYNGGKKFIKDALKLDSKRDYKRAWDMLTGVRVATIPAVIGAGALQQKQQGGIITDPMGQYNYPGKITNIPSNNITMQGIPYPVLGISNTGDSKLMQPNMNYKFKGKSVLEIPIFQKGGSKQGYVYDPSRMQAPPSFNGMAQTTYGITPVPAPFRQVPKVPAKQVMQPIQKQKTFVPMQPVIYPQAHSTYQEVTPVPNPFYVANEDFVLPQMSQTQFARTLSNINEKQQSRQNDFWMNPYLNYITSPNPLFNPLIKNLSRKDQILARLAQPKRKSNKLF